MTKRERLAQRKENILKKIEVLKQQYKDTTHDELLLNDKRQWFTESVELCTVSKRPKKQEEMLIGKINWVEFFYDQAFPKDKSKGVSIPRHKVVRVNGKWI